MIELAEIKSYIKIDDNSYDSELDLLRSVAVDYVKGAVGRCKEEDARTKLLILAVVQHLFDSRNLYASDHLRKTQELDRVFGSIIQQLKIESYGAGDDDD